MFYEQLKLACKNNGRTVTAVLKQIGIGTANGTYWKNGSVPSSDVVVKLAEHLGVSTDYLLIGKENPSLIQPVSVQLSNGREQEIMRLFRMLSSAEQDRLIGRAELLAEQARCEENVG